MVIITVSLKYRPSLEKMALSSEKKKQKYFILNKFYFFLYKRGSVATRKK